MMNEKMKEAFVDELRGILLKSAQAPVALDSALGLILKHWKPIAIGGGSILGYEKLKDIAEAQRIGQAVQEQQGR